MGDNKDARQQQTRGNNNLQENFKAVVRLIEQNEVNYDQLHELAEKIAKDLKLNSTKIRKFYDFVKKTKIMKQLGQEVDLKRDLNRFIAILLYDAGREEDKKKKLIMKEFAEGMRQIAEKVKIHSKLEYAYDVFVDFFEALVAYHRYYQAVKKENEREGSER